MLPSSEPSDAVARGRELLEPAWRRTGDFDAAEEALFEAMRQAEAAGETPARHALEEAIATREEGNV